MNPEDRYTTLIDGITAMIRADSIVEEDEESLLESLRDSNPSFLAERLIDGQPVTSDATSIVIKDKIFVLSGDFRLLKSAVKQLIREVGGRTHPTVIKKADYLVTADAESKNWSTSAGGTKVQKALKYEIPIIRESALFGALKATA
jgi:NAD-dependent DNA ligase